MTASPTSRDIINRLIRDKQCPHRMGLFEHFWDDTQPAWELEGLPKGVDLQEYFDYDIRFIPGAWVRSESIVDQKIVVEETDETIVTINGWGAKLRHWKHKSGTPEHLDFELNDEKIWRKKYREPLLHFDIRRLGDLEQLKLDFNRLKATDKFIVIHDLFLVEIMRASMGDVNMLEGMYLNPAWIHDFADVVTDMMIRHFDAMITEIGRPDGAFIYEDMGYTYGPIMSPEMQREFVLPYHKRFFDLFHSHGLPVILHSCGKIRPYLDSMVESGIDCLQVLEAKAGQHVAEFASHMNNKIAFMGNLNIKAYEPNDRAILESEILPKLDLIRKNRIPYVFHSDHSIPKSVKLDTYRYSLELFHRHGHY
jgi:uroporphyrinogen decarboxylase